jgi:DNA-binding response OmpR family regulator
LEESGLFEVDSFTDPELALSTFSPKRYDLVILDIRMPKIDGLELYKRIKIIDGKVKVCFLSSVHDLGEYKRIHADTIDRIQNGPDECFMDKPIGTQQLIRCINKIVMSS